jgi:hypothetical protein
MLVPLEALFVYCSGSLMNNGTGNGGQYRSYEGHMTWDFSVRVFVNNIFCDFYAN